MTYHIPSLAEIKAMKRLSGLKAVSTFSGCGGACLGLNWGGIDVLWASEFIDAAADTYQLNHMDTYLDRRDIREVAAASILETINMEPGELDLLEGSPPCAAFSTVGNVKGGREQRWGTERKYSDSTQRVDDLFFEFVRLVEGIQPRYILAENVMGLTRGSARGYLKEIVGRLRDAGPGYEIKLWKLDAQWMGVPQTRQRLIFVGVRSDIEGFPEQPTPQPQVTYGEATAAPIDNIDGDESYKTFKEGTKSRQVFDRMMPGQSGADVMGKGHFFNFQRVHPDRPAPCIMQGSQLVAQPTGPDTLTIGQLRRLCGFPDDFQLTGSFAQRWERLGRAVVPPMYKAVAEQIVTHHNG